jgi:hypothetical protein
VWGQFTQEDPIGIAGGLNLYGYANGDPINFSDPFGLCPQRDFDCEDAEKDPKKIEMNRDLREVANAEFPFSVELSGTLGNGTVTCGDGCAHSLELGPPQIGGSLNVVVEFGEGGENPFSFNLGASRHTGLSFFENGFSLNIGLAAGGAPISVSAAVGEVAARTDRPPLRIQSDATSWVNRRR